MILKVLKLSNVQITNNNVGVISNVKNVDVT